jgi:type IX secretion system PorP/SprF family membrane protein
MKTLFSVLFFTFYLLQTSIAQEIPIYSQIFINPYYYNPAYAGSEDRPAFYVNRRQQWTGIPGAPVTTGFNFHTIFNQKVNFGVNIYNDERSILNTTKGLITVGYRASFDDYHYISFALSGGIGSNTIDLDAVDLDDPAILGLLDNILFLDGNAGFNYYNKGFNLGLSLPKIFNTRTISYTSFNMGEISPLNDAILMSSYKWEISEEKFAFEPHIIYYYTKNLPAQYEVIGLLHFNDAFWIGASYRKDLGIAGYAGFSIKDKFKVGYAYELFDAQQANINYSTHDIQLALMIGERKKKGKINLIQKRRNMLRAMGKAPAKKDNNIHSVEKDPFVPATVAAEEYNEEEALKDFLAEMEKDAIQEKIELEDKQVELAIQEFQEEPLQEDSINIFNFKFDDDIIPKKEVDNVPKTIITTQTVKQVEARKPKNNLKKSAQDEITFEDFTESKDTTGYDLDLMAEELLRDVENDTYEEFLDPTLDEEGFYIGPKTVVKGNHLLELEKGNYVVLGVFGNYRSAEEYSDQLFIKGIRTKFGFISQTKTYYVYVFVSEIHREAQTVSNQHKKLKIQFKENWILRVQ